jgi:hypothetical protein
MDKETKNKIRKSLENNFNIIMCQAGWDNAFVVIEQLDLLYKEIPLDLLKELQEYNDYAKEVYEESDLPRLEAPRYALSNFWVTDVINNSTSIAGTSGYTENFTWIDSTGGYASTLG